MTCCHAKTSVQYIGYVYTVSYSFLSVFDEYAMNTVSVYTAPTKTLFAVSLSNSGLNGNLNKLTRVLTLGHSETQNFKYLKKKRRIHNGC